MTIEKIIKYRTMDGQEWGDYSEAERHEQRCNNLCNLINFLEINLPENLDFDEKDALKYIDRIAMLITDYYKLERYET